MPTHKNNKYIQLKQISNTLHKWTIEEIHKDNLTNWF